MNTWIEDDEESRSDGGLPDAAFTENELASGIQHLVNAGNPNYRKLSSKLQATVVDGEWDCAELDDPFSEDYSHLRFETFDIARSWARANPGCTIVRAAGAVGYEGRQKQQGNASASTTGHPANTADSIRLNRIWELAPILHEALVRPLPICRSTFSYPLSIEEWIVQLHELQPSGACQLLMLLEEHLRFNKSKIISKYIDLWKSSVSSDGGIYFDERRDYRRQEVMVIAIAHIEARQGISHEYTAKGFSLYNATQISSHSPSLSDALCMKPFVWRVLESEFRGLDNIQRQTLQDVVSSELDGHRTAISRLYMSFYVDKYIYPWRYKSGRKGGDWYSERAFWRKLPILERALTYLKECAQ